MKAHKKLKIATALSAVLTLSAGVNAADQVPTSKWGADDEIGAMNYITPSSVLTASKLIKQGKVYGLGMAVNKDTPAFRHRYFEVHTSQPEPKTFGTIDLLMSMTKLLAGLV
ncbi:hypothetical protein [Pseudoalteromonas issachenkonii]|uniref:Uncharacterized protein n=1 Tax=Pseudoalteromonas issachenkonii TaxID=152297 RepID=A0ABM6N038_9GAMM|nr:hypothetical protein [Pseudoalteromonas issachenkonii]ATC89535.1 hypothetical protein PISS_a0496 [Pseudoalteromonas issachenkonii]